VIARTAAARAAASVILAAGLVAGTAGCTFFATQATLIQYDPSDGVGTDIGSVQVRNVLAIIGDDGQAISLLVTLVNSGSRNANVNLQYLADGEKVTIVKTVRPHSVASFGTSVDEEQIVVVDPGVKAGQLFPVYVQYGEHEGKELLVPVLTGDNETYEALKPVVGE
jgi:hypothetical protein